MEYVTRQDFNRLNSKLSKILELLQPESRAAKKRMVRAKVVLMEIPSLTKEQLRGIRNSNPDLCKEKETGHFVYDVEAIKMIA